MIWHDSIDSRFQCVFVAVEREGGYVPPSKSKFVNTCHKVLIIVPFIESETHNVHLNIVKYH